MQVVLDVGTKHAAYPGRRGAVMTDDVAYLEVLAGFEQSIETTQRGLTIAQELIDAHRSGRPLPDAVIDSYLAGIEDNQAQLRQLRANTEQFRSWFRVH